MSYVNFNYEYEYTYQYVVRPTSCSKTAYQRATPAETVNAADHRVHFTEKVSAFIQTGMSVQYN